MKPKIILTALAATTISSSAAITIASTGTSGATDVYAATMFSGISVLAGDVLVVNHSNNKRSTSNAITAAFSSGANAFSTVASGDSGSQAGSWVFYSTITEAGSFDITLDTSNATKTVSHATTYLILREDTGGTLNVISQNANATSGGTTVSLAFSWAGDYDDYLAIAGAAVNTGPVISPGGDWSEDLNRGDKRLNYTNTAVSASPLNSFSVTTSASDNLSAAGIVIGATAIPEPASILLGSLGTLLLLRRRR